MNKLYKLLLICLLMLSGGMALKAQNVDDTFSIESKEDLITFADLVENNKSLNARLYADIDLEGGYWNTICETALYYNSYSNDYGYSGTFDGNGHVIKNFKVKSSTTADASAGLFGTVCGTIKNLGVENFTFEDGGKDIRAAAIVGQLITTGGKISNCYVKNATITPGEHVTGGIAGCVYDGTIENCYVVNSNINGSSGRYGHIVGDSRGDKSSTDRPGTVTNCYSDNTPLISDRKGNLSSVENKSAAQFASGEIAYLLQGEQQTDIWGQNIDNGETKETLPVLGGAKVYKIYNSGCTHYGEFIYSNDANAEFYHEHSFTEDSNGFCTLCNGYEAAELVDGVYHIGNLGQLMWFANNVNTAHKVLLTADITIDNSVVWKPIGLQDGASNSSIFNGDGHTITFENTNEGSVFGLFNSYNYSIIENLYLAGSITCNTTENVGALVNSAYRTTIRNVISTCDVTNTASSGNVGGLAANFGGKHDGGLYSLIENCAVYADVTGSGNVGGLVGQGWNGTQYWDITNAAYVGNITGANAGAIVGHQATDSNISTFTNIYWCENDGLSFYGKRDTENQSYINTSDKTTEQFASGEVAYLLQGEQETQVWGQNIDNGETKEALPVLGGAKVYHYESDSYSMYTNKEFDITPHGKCGDNLYWNVTDNILTIFGTGAMYDYEYDGDNISPWRKLETAPTSLVLEEGITHIGNSAFDDCSGFTGSLTIPNSVTSIGKYAFYDCKGFTGDLTIPNSVTSIGEGAFYNCTKFNGSLTIGNSVTTIGNSAFSSCKLSGSLTIPNSVTNIGDYAFQNCSGFNGSLTIPNSVTTIGAYAFFGCSGFTGSLTIPNSVTTIGNYAFKNCYGFTGSLTIPNSVTSIGEGAFYNCTKFNGSLTIGNSVTAIGYYAFSGCSSFTDVYSFAVTAPTLGKNAFSDINSNAILYYPTSGEQSYNDKGWFDYFSNRKAFNGQCGDNLYWYVDGNNTLTIFGTGAMYDYDNSNNKAPWRNLETPPTSLILEDGITHIGNYAFRDCKGLSGSLTIPNSVTTIGNYAFCNCEGFTGSLTIPNNVTTIGNYAFYSCRGFTGSLTIPNSVTSIGNSAFFYCKGFTGDLTIPNSVTTIGKSAFCHCSGFTGSLTIPNSVTTIGNEAFGLCSGFTGSLTIPNSVTTIGEWAFSECSGFTGSLTIPNNVTSIGECTFYGCSGFTGSLTIPNSVTYIGNEAFKQCNGFSDVCSLAETAPTLGKNAFSDINSNATLYYPTSGEQSYNDKGWFDYFSNRKAFNGKCGDNLYWYVDENNALTIYGTGAMYDYDNSSNKAPWRNLKTPPTSLVLEEGISHIGSSAFFNCSGLSGSLTIGNSVTTIGIYAFYGCSGFTGALTIGNSVTTIGNSAFYNCSGFTGDLTIPNSVTAIGNSAFYYCEGFTGALTIPNSVTTIGEWAFSDCSGFTGSLTIPNSVTSIGKSAFSSCSGFTGDLTIPNSVATIGDYAFYNCSGFTGDLTIPNSVATIGDYAFYNCSGFTEVYSLAETAPTLGTEAFPMFKEINPNITLYYPVSGEQSYNDKGWFDYFSIRKAFNGKCGDNLYWYVDENNALTIFGTGAMYDYDNSNNKAPWRNLATAPTSLVLEKGITHIGERAFYNCYRFKGDLTIGNSVTSIGNYAFYSCYGFNGDLTIGNSVTTIGEHAFDACSGFKGDLTIGNSVKTIGDYAFNFCYRFTGDLTIPNSVTTIGNYAFYDCKDFTGDLTIPNSVKTIGNYAFYNCSGFTGSLTIPNSVTTIGNYTFRNCSGFTGTLTIPNSVTTIGIEAFRGCSGFTGDLTIPNSVTSIGNYAFRDCSGLSEIFLYRDTNPTIGSNGFNDISSTAKIYVPVIWSSFTGIPSSKLVKMATFVGQQSTDNGQQSSSTAWVGLAEGQTEPEENDHVAINAPMVISGQQSAVSGQQSVANSLSVKSFGYCGNGTTVNGSITIEDGGQLYCEVARGEVTVKKEIVGYQQSAVSGQQSESESESKWYTIASPLKDTIQIIPNSSFLTPNSDLYRYDEPSYTWQNAKNSANNGFNTIDPSRGYLYANAENTTLEFKGNINTETVTYNLTAKSDVLNGFHLVGNPFTHNITFAHLNATEGASLVNGYYVLNGEGAWGATLGSNEDDVIKVGQGVLVKATAEGTLAISRQPSAVSLQRSGKGQQFTAHSSLQLTVSNAKYSDRAFVVFDKGVGLDKMNHENENIPLLYIPMEDADYAIAMMDINVNEIPVNFETNVMGEYTISLRQENCEFDELYLLDKETDEKVNILEQDYTFIATSSENPERFILMKDAQGSQLEAHSHFAYINNGDIVIYNIEGDADIKIFDALGRCVYQGESSDETTRIANGYSSGVYMIQKVDDNGVNVQKIIL